MSCNAVHKRDYVTSGRVYRFKLGLMGLVWNCLATPSLRRPRAPPTSTFIAQSFNDITTWSPPIAKQVNQTAI